MTQQSQPEIRRDYGLADGVQDLCAFGGIALVGYGGFIAWPPAGLIAAGLLLVWIGTRG